VARSSITLSSVGVRSSASTSVRAIHSLRRWGPRVATGRPVDRDRELLSALGGTQNRRAVVAQLALGDGLHGGQL